MNSLNMRALGRNVTIGGITYALDFDMAMLGYAEQVYLEAYDRNVNAGDIIKELYGMKLAAVGAVIYGAMRSAGEKVAWNEFSRKIFTFDNFSDLFDVAMGAIESMMLPADADGAPTDGEDGPGN